MKRALTIVIIGLSAGALSPPAAAEGDAEAGKDIFEARCQACHTLEQGDRDRAGPNLFGLFGSTAGQRAYSFKRHSQALKESGIVWDQNTLDAFLHDPRQYIPNNRMRFPGLAKQKDRDDVIAYLEAVTK